MSTAPRDVNRNPRRRLRVVLALAVSTVASLVFCEIALRFLMFSDTKLALRLGKNLRDPALYCAGEETDDYWKLQHLTADPAHVLKTPNADTRVGWTGYAITPGTYEHKDEGKIGAKQPVLLYGDSFAQCNTTEAQCFQGLLADSDLAERYAMLNYGVGGYGLDQTYLLLKSSIDRFKDKDPIVLVGILVDNDLERSVLTFRCWPKPRLHVEGERLVGEAAVDTDLDHFLDEHPPDVSSYLWRLLAYKPGILPAALQAKMRCDESPAAEMRALNKKILAEIHAELESRGLRHVFFLFHGQGSLPPDSPHDWQEPLVTEVCRELSIPMASSRPYLMAACGGDFEVLARFFGQEGKLNGHYNGMGNAIVFAAMRRAIEGRSDEGGADEIRALVASGRLEELVTRHLSRDVLGFKARITNRSEGWVLRSSQGREPPFDSWPDEDRLCIRPGEYGPTDVELSLAGKARKLTGIARSVILSSRTCAARPVELSIEGDGRVLFRELVPHEAPGTRLEIDLAGVQNVTLRVSAPDGDEGCNSLCISAPSVN